MHGIRLTGTGIKTKNIKIRPERQCVLGCPVSAHTWEKPENGEIPGEGEVHLAFLLGIAEIALGEWYQIVFFRTLHNPRRSVMPIDFTPAQKDLLATILEKELADVRVEIHHTDKFEFKQQLKEREKLLLELTEKLK
jgi:hypothetical protein